MYEIVGVRWYLLLTLLVALMASLTFTVVAGATGEDGPDRIDVHGITLAECDHWGGRYVDGVCEDVDH